MFLNDLSQLVLAYGDDSSGIYGNSGIDNSNNLSTGVGVAAILIYFAVVVISLIVTIWGLRMIVMNENMTNSSKYTWVVCFFFFQLITFIVWMVYGKKKYAAPTENQFYYPNMNGNNPVGYPNQNGGYPQVGYGYPNQNYGNGQITGNGYSNGSENNSSTEFPGSLNNNDNQ